MRTYFGRIVRLYLWVTAVLGGTAVLLFHFIPFAVQKLLNRVVNPPAGPKPVLRQPIPVVDLHADPPLWRRDWLKHNQHGHIDLPRLIEGNVVVQVFAAATKIPLGINFEQNSTNQPDLLTLLAFGQGWPRRTWGSLLQRALFMAERVKELEGMSNGRFRLIQSTADLQQLLNDRQNQPDMVGGLLALEGIHALEGKLTNLDMLYDAGFRIIGLTHFFDNDAGGSAHGLEQGGLTPFGRELIRRIQEGGMILDLAHAAPRLIDDVLAISQKPLIVSHTGFQGVHDSPRNLSDDHARAIAATGGLMGMAFFPETTGGDTLVSIVKAIRYGVDLVGIEHIAIGTDFDGAITAPIDASGMPYLVEALSQSGFSDAEIRMVMGGNALALLKRLLPDKRRIMNDGEVV
ncbi:MAG: dipeptidase [Ardenticatenaceae bacterium]|nr:dipeptidase [Ardenticatenaceae bacterium]MCB9445723.1 dipeptidase [Ardenticatenaceae bacterium]